MIGPCAGTLELPFLVRHDGFFLFCPGERVFLYFLPPFSEEDYLVHGQFIRVPTVMRSGSSGG